MALRAGRGPAAADAGPRVAATPRGGPSAGGAARPRPGGPHLRASRARILRLRRWLAGFERPPASVVRSDEHRGAGASGRGRGHHAGPRRSRARCRSAPDAGDRIAVITPTPRDLTPADSSVDEPLDLADAVRRHHRRRRSTCAVGSRAHGRRHRAARQAAAGAAGRAIVATLATNVQPAQARLVEALLADGRPTVTVAMRTPYDLADYPACGHAPLQLRHRARRASRRSPTRSSAVRPSAAGCRWPSRASILAVTAWRCSGGPDRRRSASSPRCVARLLREAAPRWSASARRSARPTRATSSSPRGAPPTTPPSTPSTPWASGPASTSASRPRACTRSTVRRRTMAARSSSASASRAPRRTSSASSARHARRVP